MSSEPLSTPIALATAVALCLLFLALAIALWRIIRAESPFDRVVALDLIGGVCLCCLVIFAIRLGQPILLDSAFALALMSYLGTVAFARYLEKGDD